VIDLVDWNEPGLRVALARRDITTLYRRLVAAGVTQKRIGELTGQSQSEVSEIIKGRQVMGYDLLVRIAEGLGIPRGWMGLTYEVSSIEFAPDVQVDDDPRTFKEASEAVKRRRFLAAATMAVVDRPFLGAVVALDHTPVATPLPTKIVQADVTALHDLTERFRVLGRAGQGVSDVLSSVVHRADQLLTMPAAGDAVQQALLSQLADLHTLAGWWCTDMLQVDIARYHYSRALRLAADAGDTLAMVSAVSHAAHMDRELGAPNDALKLYQMAQGKLSDLPGGHPELPAQRASLYVRSAHCWALLDRPHHAREQLARAGDLPTLKDPFERALADAVRAFTELALGQIDAAEQYATNSVRTWSPDDRRESAYARIALAATHAVAGELDTARTAVAAFDAVDELSSAFNRAMLAPLEQALAARKDSTSVELAQRARALRLQKKIQ
jgi:transcriptional regulator with XRE-family HTH domain